MNTNETVIADALLHKVHEAVSALHQAKDDKIVQAEGILREAIARYDAFLITCERRAKVESIP